MALDPNFNNVILLLHCDGANNGTTFTDMSPLAQTISVGAGAKTVTSQKKFGTASYTTDTYSAGLTATNAAYALGTGDFTVEFWVYAPTGTWNSLSSYCPLVQLGSFANGLFTLTLEASGGLPYVTLYGYSSGWSTIINGTNALPTNQWVHVAVTRSGTTFKSWINGVQDDTGTSSINFSLTDLYVGVDDGGQIIGPGFMDDVRITKGVARYTATFTPPTAAFPDAPEPYYYNVTALLHMDGANNGTTFTDTGPLTNTVTRVGSAVTATSQVKFGTASGLFNGTTDALSISNAALVLGLSDYTIEFFFRAPPVGSAIPGQYPTAFTIGEYGVAGNLWINIDPGGGIGVGGNDGSTLIGLGGQIASYTDSVWHHVAFTRSGTTFTTWYDGVSAGTTTGTYNITPSIYRIAYDGSASADGFYQGYIDELRVTKGVARYTTTFTPPTSAFPDAFGPAAPIEETLAQNLTAADVLSSSYRYQSSATISLVTSDTVEALHKRAAIVTEPVRLQEVIAPTARLSQAVSQTISTSDSVNVARPVTLVDATAYSDNLAFSQAVTAVEQLGLTELLAAGATYRGSFSDTIRWTDSLRNFFGEDFSDTLSISSVLSPSYLATRTLTDSLALSETLGGSLVFRLTAVDGINLDDVDVLKMIFGPTIEEGLELSAAYISPNGSITTWAVNTETGAVTEYSNYAFNSFAQIDHKYLGASSSGLYELNGDDDAGTDIVATLKTGLAQFGGSRFSMFKAAYLGVRGGGNFVLRLETGDGKYYDYNVIAQDMQTTKIRLGKGLRARYFSFQLTSTGQDFDMDSIEFVPVVAQRRV